MDNGELDRLVAEKVMGWKLKNICTSSWGSKADVWVNEAITEKVTTYEDGTFGVSDRPKIQVYANAWKPSTDPAAAMQALEEIERRLGCEISIQIRSNRHGMNRVWNGKQWQRKRYAVTVSLGTIAYDSPHCSFTIYGDSLGVAACEAALKAVESSVSDDELELLKR